MAMMPEAEAAPRYQIVEVIGRGGMGEVCLADDLMLHRQVALKFVTSAGGDVVDHLLSEARAAAGLDHPFICSIYEVTRLNGRPCIAMELVRGQTLERRLRRGPLPIADALHIAEEIAEALGVAITVNAGAALVYSARTLDAHAALAPVAASSTS